MRVISSHISIQLSTPAETIPFKRNTYETQQTYLILYPFEFESGETGGQLLTADLLFFQLGETYQSRLLGYLSIKAAKGLAASLA